MCASGVLQDGSDPPLLDTDQMVFFLGIVLFLPPIYLINHVGKYTVVGVLKSMKKK